MQHRTPKLAIAAVLVLFLAAVVVYAVRGGLDSSDPVLVDTAPAPRPTATPSASASPSASPPSPSASASPPRPSAAPTTPSPTTAPGDTRPPTGRPTSGTGPATAGKLLWSFGGSRDSYRPEVEDGPGNVSFPTPPYARDGAVMRVRFPQGQTTGYKFNSRFGPESGADGKHLGIGAPRSDVSLSYDMYIPKGTNLEYHGKLPGLGGVPAGQDGWYTSTGGNMKPDSFSVRMHVRPSSNRGVGHPHLESYIYAWQANGQRYGAGGYKYGISVPLTTDASNRSRTGKNMTIPTGRWFTITQRIKLNTPGVSDGLYEAWIDGVKAVSLHDVQWRKAGVTTGVNQLVGHTFANSPGYPASGYFDYDNFTLRAR